MKTDMPEALSTLLHFTSSTNLFLPDGEFFLAFGDGPVVEPFLGPLGTHVESSASRVVFVFDSGNKIP